MTNYEWLIETNQFEDFLIDVATAFKCMPANYEGWKDKKYRGLNVNSPEYSRITEALQAWLQAEHKEAEKYVRLDDVINVLNNPLNINVESYRGKITLSEMSRAFAEDYKDKMNRINSLAVKEIDE